MKKIGIIGAGFTGTMTAVHLIEKSTAACEVILIDRKDSLNKGIAYDPYSFKHLLNVVAGNMSAYAHDPDHFLEWVLKRDDLKNQEKSIVKNTFLPRQIYGEYLVDIWEKAKQLAPQKQIKIRIIDSYVDDLNTVNDEVYLYLNSGEKLVVNDCIITSGNNVPGNPRIKNMEFYAGANYFQNPWKIESVKNIRGDSVLIIGNGLTMVDTVLALVEQDFKGKIYSISPNGFNILPHPEQSTKYSYLADELRDGMNLYEVLRLVNKHRKRARNAGLSAAPVIDSLRPFTQKIWQSFSEKEKQIFVLKLRHFWNITRHRIPQATHKYIQQLREAEKLHIISGKLIDLTEHNNVITVNCFDKKEKSNKVFKVCRVINCTGPESNLLNIEKNFLKNCLLKGLLQQDALGMGIKTDTNTFQIINAEGKAHHHLFTIGSNLKGALWESTAVNELRNQAEKLAQLLISRS